MEYDEYPEELDSQIGQALIARLLASQAQEDALVDYYMFAQRGEISKIETKIDELESSLGSSTTLDRSTAMLGGSSGKSLAFYIVSLDKKIWAQCQPEYRSTFLITLKEFLANVKEHRETRPGLHPIAAQGYRHAFKFALEAYGVLSTVKNELEKEERGLLERLSENPNGSMKLGNSPRIYIDGYIAGLREAAEIIEKIVNESG